MLEKPRLGWLVCRPGREPLGYTLELREQFVPRKTQIFAAEAIIPLMVLLLSPELLVRSDVVWFIDNEAAVSSLIRGTSRAEDVGHLAAAVHILCLKLEVRIWFEWIDSKSNPADGLSDGLRDEWTCRQVLANGRDASCEKGYCVRISCNKRRSPDLIGPLNLNSLKKSFPSVCTWFVRRWVVLQGRRGSQGCGDGHSLQRRPEASVQDTPFNAQRNQRR